MMVLEAENVKTYTQPIFGLHQNLEGTKSKGKNHLKYNLVLISAVL